METSEPSGSFFCTIRDSALNDSFVRDPDSGDAATSGVLTFTPAISSLATTMTYSATQEAGEPQGDCRFIG
jgi:hypothetical protein